MRAIVAVPARYASTRLPGKALLDLGGRTTIQRVVANMLQISGVEVVVVTDDERIADSALEAGSAAFVSVTPAASGSDRIRNWLEESGHGWPEKLVNVQGDEPLLEPQAVEALISLLERRSAVRVATLLRPLEGPEEASDPNVVKAALLPNGVIADFARLPGQELAAAESEAGLDCARRHRWLAHVGVYAFRGEAFRAFTDLPASPRERRERLEQLRLLEGGIAVHGVPYRTRAIGLDTPEDVERILRELSARPGAPVS